MDVAALGLGTIIGAALTGATTVYRDLRNERRIERAVLAEMIALFDAIDAEMSALNAFPGMLSPVDEQFGSLARFIERCEALNIGSALSNTHRRSVFGALNRIVRIRYHLSFAFQTWDQSEKSEQQAVKFMKELRQYGLWGAESARNALLSLDPDNKARKEWQKPLLPPESNARITNTA